MQDPAPPGRTSAARGPLLTPSYSSFPPAAADAPIAGFADAGCERDARWSDTVEAAHCVRPAPACSLAAHL